MNVEIEEDEMTIWVYAYRDEPTENTRWGGERQDNGLWKAKVPFYREGVELPGTGKRAELKAIYTYDGYLWAGCSDQVYIYDTKLALGSRFVTKVTRKTPIGYELEAVDDVFENKVADEVYWRADDDN